MWLKFRSQLKLIVLQHLDFETVLAKAFIKLMASIRSSFPIVSCNLIGSWYAVFQLRLHIDDSQYVLYRGPNASDVWRQWDAASQSWLNLMPWKTNTVSLALFNDTCIGVDTLAKYSIEIIIKCESISANYILIRRSLLLFNMYKSQGGSILFARGC